MEMIRKEFLFQTGSFQLFVENHVDADVFLKQLEQKNFFPEEVTSKFQSQFERLVVLDYIIRNTGKAKDGEFQGFSFSFQFRSE